MDTCTTSSSLQGYIIRSTAITLAISVAMGMSPRLFAEETLTVYGVSSADLPWQPSPTLAAKQSITAMKTAVPIIKTPQSISVISQQEISTRQAATVKRALDYTPGVVNSTRGASTTYDHVMIRGFAANGQNQNNYLDNLKLQGDFWNDPVIDPYMLERIEVLRGPTSVLYGKSNPGGIVNMISKRPSGQTQREVQFRLGSDHLMQTGIDIDDATEDGQVKWRLVATGAASGQQQADARQQRYALAPSLTWQPSARTHLTLLTYLQAEPEVGYYGWLPQQGTVNPLPNGTRLSTRFNEGATNNHFARDQRMLGYQFEHQLNATTSLRQNLRFNQMQTEQRSVYGQGICQTLTCPQVSSDALSHTLLRGSVTDQERLNSLAIDNQVAHTINAAGVTHSLLAGIDYQHMRNNIAALFDTAPPLDLYQPQQRSFDFAPPRPYQLNRMQQAGLYLQDQAQWRAWVVTLGVRQDWLQQASTLRQDGGQVTRNDAQLTWRGGINYLFDNGVAPYVSYSQSFEPNGFDLFNTPRRTFAPARGEQVEIGIKYIPSARPVVVTAALYQLTKSNNLTADPHDAFKQIPAGEIRARGIELEAKAALSYNANVTAAWSLSDVKYTKDTELKGHTPAQLPRSMWSLWGDYTLPSGALTGASAGLGMRYTGVSYGDRSNRLRVSGTLLMDMMLRYELAQLGLEGAQLALNVNNLLNRHYVASCFTDYGCYWGADRQIVASMTLRF